MRAMTILATAVLSITALAQTAVPVEPFRSVELRNGGHVIVRHGSTQRVAVLRGDRRDVRVRVDGAQLVIDTGHGHERLQLEVVTPHLPVVSVSNGGTLQILDGFPAQAAIEARVEQGGTIDIRAIAADVVDASVDSGGRIFTTARQALSATIDSGGVIKYWGNPRVKKSVRDGGVVSRAP